MARHIVKVSAVVLRTRRMGETSKLVTLYTAEYGKLKVVAKGARKPRSRYGAALELFNEIQAVCYLRDGRDLHTLSDGDASLTHPSLSRDMERLVFASAACELIDSVTLEGESNDRLFQCLTGVLRGLEEVRQTQLEPLFWYFQIRAASALGYRPELVQCVSCRRHPDGSWRWFSAAHGGVVCSRCNAGGAIRMAGESLAFLARLQSIRTYKADVIPSLPQGAEEIRDVLRHFLAHYGGGRGGLRALDCIDRLNGCTRVPAASHDRLPAES